MGTGDIVWTIGWVPGVASVAVGITTNVVNPAPVRVENDGGTLRGTCRPCTVLKGEGRVGLSSVGADLLRGNADRKECEGKEDYPVEHGCPVIANGWDRHNRGLYTRLAENTRQFGWFALA